MLLQQADEGLEQCAVEATGIKIARRHVGGRHQHHAQLEQAGEQPAEDHGVGNVGDMKFVEAEQPGFFRDLIGGEPDRIDLTDFAALDLVAKNAHARMHIGHELMEMGAALALRRTGGEEQVHQHGLAATDFAVDVETY